MSLAAWVHDVEYTIFKLEHMIKMYPHWSFEEVVDALEEED